TNKQTRIKYKIFSNLINEFGSLEAFKDESNAMAIFGCGWTWLVQTEFQMLRIVNSYNAGTALDTTRTQSVEPNFDSLSAPVISYVKEKEKSLQAPSAAPSAPPPNHLRFTPLLVLSVWEHAYLTDYGVNGRDKYIDQFWECVNWEKVDQRATFD
ncbi:11120_t:CDS:2, partial [Ambispora leptoticha]